jgi:predicted MFS family arabinose efflux permease
MTRRPGAPAEAARPSRVGSVRLATAGIGLVGVSFGMARYGYGLLLPDIRRDFGLGPALLGLIGTGSYAGYLLATALTGRFANRAGARRTAVAGGLLAAGGMTLAGLAPTPEVFAAAIVLAGASAALCYAPFADAAQVIDAARRPRVLSAINCGTGYGVAAAVPIAILAGEAWRGAWLGFAAIALAATAWAARVLPRTTPASSTRALRGAPWRLLAGAVVLGAGSSAYWTFAVTHVVDSGALTTTGSRAFLAVAGIAGVLATGTGDLMRRVGPTRAFRLLAAVEAAGIGLLAVAPGTAFLSAVLFGAAYNAAVGVQAIESTRLTPTPSAGLAAAMGANGVGLMLGPVLAGALAESIGLGGVLALGAALVLVAPQPATRPRLRAACASQRPAAQR